MIEGLESTNKETVIDDCIQADFKLCERVIARDPEAGQEFYEKYHRLARYFGSIAARQCVTGVVDSEDLSQEALLYMLKEADKYDIDRNMPFSSFTSVFMRHHLNKKVCTQYGTKVSVSVSNIIAKIAGINNFRLNENRHCMTDEEIAEEFNIPLGPPNDGGVTVGGVRQALLLTIYLGSIDNGYNPHADSSPGNSYVLDETKSLRPICGEVAPSTEDQVAYGLLKERLEEIFDGFDERDATVIRMRYGFDDGEPKSYREIGDYLGISAARVSQLELRTLRKMRNPSRCKFLQGYFDIGT